MSTKKVWNDKSRLELRERIRSMVLGELRLAKRVRDEILVACREVYIQDECPKREQKDFVQFADDELGRAEEQLAIEQASWPEDTDCDRLDRVEGSLIARGILFWQASPCCDTCTGGELPDRLAIIEERHPGFKNRLRGYSFFIDQNLPEMLSENSEISVFLAYGWCSPDGSEITSEEYQKNALGIAREVCECLRDERFETDWNGDFSRKIGITLNWQRRTVLK